MGSIRYVEDVRRTKDVHGDIRAQAEESLRRMWHRSSDTVSDIVVESAWVRRAIDRNSRKLSWAMSSC